MQTKGIYQRAKGKRAAVLNHKLIKVLLLSTSNAIAAGKYMIHETVIMQSHHCAGVGMPSRPLTWSVTPDMTC